MCIILITIYLLIEVVKQHNQSVKNVQRPQPQAYYLSQSQRKLELSERGFWDKRPMGSGGIFWNNMEIMCLGMFILPVHFLCFALCFKELINNFLKLLNWLLSPNPKRVFSNDTVAGLQVLMMHGARTNMISGDNLVYGFMPAWTHSQAPWTGWIACGPTRIWSWFLVTILLVFVRKEVNQLISMTIFSFWYCLCLRSTTSDTKWPGPQKLWGG